MELRRHHVSLFKLDQNVKGRGLCCGSEGLFLAGRALLERDSEGRFQPRPSAKVRKIFSDTYRTETDWDSRVRSVSVIAKALNKGDIARAMIAAVLMRMPDPDGAIRISDVDGILAKAGFDPLEPRDEHGRWTNEGSASATASRQAFLEPFVEPLIGPMIEDEPVEPETPPGMDNVPPTLGPRRIEPNPPLENPYPDRPECVEQWDYALRACKDLLKRGKLKWDDSRRYSITFGQCVKGMVSEDCGGTPVEYG